jgi:hypothetical protein
MMNASRHSILQASRDRFMGLEPALLPRIDLELCLTAVLVYPL